MDVQYFIDINKHMFIGAAAGPSLQAGSTLVT